ncbi:MAG: NAD(P)H-binding protein [Anaerolineales bacterium]
MTANKRVCIIGGTGFLGYHTAQEFLAAGWEVTVVGLPPAPPAGLFSASVRLVIQDIHRLADSDLASLLAGQDGLVFAAGLDDRLTPPRPAYPKFHAANVASLERLIRLAKEAGVRRLVVLGSYFTYFDRLWPALKLAERHPYIRSRLEQARLVTSAEGIEGIVLELPYIFGALPLAGWKPLWAPLIQYLRSSHTLFYMKGGTACISALTVGRAVLAAMERGQAGLCYPIGQENLTWEQMLTRLAAAEGRRVRVLPLPGWLIHLAMRIIAVVHALQGKEGGLNLAHFASLQTAHTFLDPEPSRQALGYTFGDLDEAFRQTLAACRSAAS